MMAPVTIVVPRRVPMTDREVAALARIEAHLETIQYPDALHAHYFRDILDDQRRAEQRVISEAA